MPRTALEILNHLLGPSTDPGEWFDVAARDARTLLAGVADSDWETLTRVWREQPIEWQRRLAYALYGAKGAHAAPIFRQMLRESDAPLLECVAYGLRTLDDESLRVAVDDENLPRLHALAKDPDHRELAEQLLTRLGAKPVPPAPAA